MECNSLLEAVSYSTTCSLLAYADHNGAEFVTLMQHIALLLDHHEKQRRLGRRAAETAGLRTEVHHTRGRWPASDMRGDPACRTDLPQRTKSILAAESRTNRDKMVDSVTLMWYKRRTLQNCRWAGSAHDRGTEAPSLTRGNPREIGDWLGRLGRRESGGFCG